MNPIWLVLLLLAVSCGRQNSACPHSVLLITLDTTRADALGAYGRAPSVTPHLDALAKECVLY